MTDIEKEDYLIQTLNTIRTEQLNLSATLVLLIINNRHNGTIYQKDIQIDFSSAKLSVNINKLIKHKMLQEVIDNEDNRRKILFISQYGKNFIKNLLFREN